MLEIDEQMKYLSDKYNLFHKELFYIEIDGKKPFEEVESDGTKMYAYNMFNIVIALK